MCTTKAGGGWSTRLAWSQPDSCELGGDITERQARESPGDKIGQPLPTSAWPAKLLRTNQHIHINTHVHTHTHIQTHIHTHTHTHTLSLSSDLLEEDIGSYYRWLWATVWLQGIELWSSGRGVSALNHWSISPACLYNFYPNSIFFILDSLFSNSPWSRRQYYLPSVRVEEWRNMKDRMWAVESLVSLT